MDKIINNKRGLALVTICSSGHKTSSEKFIYSLYISSIDKWGARAKNHKMEGPNFLIYYF